MEKDLKSLNKVYRKITDEDVKKRLEALIDEIEDTEEAEGEPAVEEEKVDATPPAKEEAPVEETTEEPKKETIDIDEIKAQLGLEKVEQIIVSYDDKIRNLEEELKKTRSSGYSPGSSQTEPDTSVDDIFARLKTNHLKK
jgi:uncharacterized coiled-coil protein SlyX